MNPFEIPFHFRDRANTVHDFLNSCTRTESHKPPSRRSIAMYQTTTSSIRTSGVDEHVGGVAGDPRRALPDIVHGVSEVHHHTAWNRRALGMPFFLNPKNVWFRLHLYKVGVVGWIFLVRSFPLELVSCGGHFFHIDRAVTEKLPCVKYVWVPRSSLWLVSCFPHWTSGHYNAVCEIRLSHEISMNGWWVTDSRGNVGANAEIFY